MVSEQSYKTALVACFIALALFGAFSIAIDDGSDNELTGYAAEERTIRVIGSSLKDVIDNATADLNYRNSFFFQSFSPEKPVNITINDERISMISLLLTTDNEIRIFWLNITSMVTHPESSKIYYDKVYQFFDIKDSKLAGNISSVEIAFRVARWWMSENYIYDDTIALRQWKDSAWKKLETVLVDKSDEYYLFKATLSSIGEFAVVGRAEPPARVEEETQTQMEERLESASAVKNGFDFIMFLRQYWQFILFPLAGLAVFFAGYRFVANPIAELIKVGAAKKTLRNELQKYIDREKEIILNERRKAEVLVDYISKARRYRSDDWIMASAMLKGWPRRLVEKAMKNAGKR